MMERATPNEWDLDRQRAGIAWALADLEHLLARQVIGRHAYEAIRLDYEARLQSLDTDGALPDTEMVVVARDPLRPPPAPRAMRRKPAEPAEADQSAGDSLAPLMPAYPPASGVGNAPVAEQQSSDGTVPPMGSVVPQPAGVTGLWINLLLFLGAFFVVIAALIFVGTQWETFGAEAKAGIMLGFTLGFIVAGLLCVRLPKVRPAGQTFLAIGAILLPLDILGGYTLLFRDRGLSAAATWALGSVVCAIL
jgi:hypothetical protein